MKTDCPECGGSWIRVDSHGASFIELAHTSECPGNVRSHDANGCLEAA